MEKPGRRTPGDDPNLGSAKRAADQIRGDIAAALAAADAARRSRSALIVALRDAGYTYAEIEAAMGVSPPDIRRALHQAAGPAAAAGC